MAGVQRKKRRRCGVINTNPHNNFYRIVAAMFNRFQTANRYLRIAPVNQGWSVIEVTVGGLHEHFHSSSVFPCLLYILRWGRH